MRERSATAPQGRAGAILKRRRVEPESLLLLVLGALQVANALWMLLSPRAWYETLPAGVPDTGPLNVHFVRDIGCAFLASGLALIVAALSSRDRLRLACVGIASVFIVGHAAVHLWDLAQGALSARHWLLDLPGVFVPALVLLAVLARLGPKAARAERRSP